MAAYRGDLSYPSAHDAYGRSWTLVKMTWTQSKHLGHRDAGVLRVGVARGHEMAKVRVRVRVRLRGRVRTREWAMARWVRVMQG